MDTISSLILDALVERHKVVLPGLGTLYVSDNGSDVLLNVDEEQEPHIVRLIAKAQQTDNDQAQEVYNQWLVGACTEEGVIIPGVGRIREGEFTPDPELKKHIHTDEAPDTKAAPAPKRETSDGSAADDSATQRECHIEPARKEPREQSEIMEETQRVSLRQLFWWVAGAVVLGAAIAIAAIWWLESQTDLMRSQPLIEPIAQTAPDTTLRADSTATGDSTTPSVAPASIQAGAAAAPKGQPATSGTVATPTKPTSTATQQPPLFRLIVGTYSSEANANKFITSAKKQDATLRYEKLIQPSGRVMVTVFGSDSEAQTLQMQRKLSDRFPDSWIAKNHRP